MTNKLVIEVGFDVRHWRTLEIANPPAELVDALLVGREEGIAQVLDVLTQRGAVQVVDNSQDDSPTYVGAGLAVLSHSLDDAQPEDR